MLESPQYKKPVLILFYSTYMVLHTGHWIFNIALHIIDRLFILSFFGILKRFIDSVINTFNEAIRYWGFVSASVEGTKLTNKQSLHNIFVVLSLCVQRTLSSKLIIKAKQTC